VVPRFGYVIEEPDKAVRLWMAEFEGLYEIGGCFMLTMHPQLTGRISRLKALEKLIRQIQGYPRVWWTTSKAIAEFWAREGLE
jgi:peptidoglycan/xylan/chitin deacetylase (PgdA/CDA1 family)